MTTDRQRRPAVVHRRGGGARWGVAAALALALASCKQGPTPIPEPSPDSAPTDSPGAAERAAIGSNTLGRPSPAPSSGFDAGVDEEAGLAVTTAINAGKKVADARAEAKAEARAEAGAAQRGAGSSAGLPGAGSGSDKAAVEAAGDTATLVFEASAAGQLVPCGCSPDQRGGLPRAAGLLAQWRKEAPGLLYVDAGDLLFANASKPAGATAPQTELKARTLARAAALLGAAARVAGARDLALGHAFAAETAQAVPLLDGGARVPGTRETLLVKAGPSGVPVGLFAAGDSDARTAEADIAARAAALRKQGARLLVLLLHARGERALSAAQQLQPAAKAAGVDLIVLGRRDDPGTDPDVVQAGGPPILAPEGHGQTLLRVDLVFPRDAGPGAPLFLSRGAQGKSEELESIEERSKLLRERLGGAAPELKTQLEQKLAQLEARKRAVALAEEKPPAGAVVATARFARLDKSVPDDPAARDLVAAYDAQVAEMNLAAAKLLPEACPKPAKGEPAYTGVSAPVKKAESCASCHAAEAGFWLRTRHARAFQTLVAQKKQFSLDCIRCHVTGWQQPGGVCRIDRTAVGGPGLPTPADRIGAGAANPLPDLLGVGRESVQCESCHGPASEHVRGGPIDRKPAQTVCLRCHEAENSPHFDYQRYLPWIVGPGHGEPLGKGEKPRTRGEISAGNGLGPNPDIHQGSP